MYGIYERGEDGGTVIIRTKETNDMWIIEIEDNGIGFDVEEYRRLLSSGKTDSTGISNILFRLEKIMHASMSINSTVNVGTSVLISVPKE